ncbi:hypothetical protein JOQ06_028767, partial [Pogonophryne albipinna]
LAHPRATTAADDGVRVWRRMVAEDVRARIEEGRRREKRRGSGEMNQTKDRGRK